MRVVSIILDLACGSQLPLNLDFSWDFCMCRILLSIWILKCHPCFSLIQILLWNFPALLMQSLILIIHGTNRCTCLLRLRLSDLTLLSFVRPKLRFLSGVHLAYLGWGNDRIFNRLFIFQIWCLIFLIWILSLINFLRFWSWPAFWVLLNQSFFNRIVFSIRALIILAHRVLWHISLFRFTQGSKV